MGDEPKQNVEVSFLHKRKEKDFMIFSKSRILSLSSSPSPPSA